MSVFIHTIIAFIIALFILVTVHEFGHYWVARKLGVKVLRFSIGFGKPLFSYRKTPDSTEYVLAPIPLGGYVSMLGEQGGEIKEEEKHLAYSSKPVQSRMAILVAGPVANIILAIVFFTLALMIGLPELKPIVADVVPDSMAQQAGIKAGDKIMAVDGKKTSSWQDVRFALLDKLLTHKDFIIKVQTTDGHDANLTLSAVDNQLLKDDGDVVENVGLKVWPLSKPEIETVAPGRAAEAAGIVSGDIVKTIDGRMIQTWQEMAAIIVESPGIELVIEVERDGSILEISITPDEMERDGQKIGQIGVSQMAHGFVFVEYPFAEAVVQGCVRSWDMSLLLLRTIGAMITGQVSLKNVNGPITIAEVVGKAASIGLGFYLNIIAIVSISLAVLNLLPIPLLDGGHLFFCAIEAIKGSPVSTVAIEFGQRIGIVVIGCLMVLAIYNDLVRWLLR